MTTPYARNFATGRDDRASGLKMTLPSAVDEQHAYRGYMDGWSGRKFNQPVAMKPFKKGSEI